MDRLVMSLTAGRRCVGVCVIFMDVDGQVPNDSFGHSAGDQLLADLGVS
jgi:GGDEF domain-containing protein